ncbi:DUF6907 domain-containing protein [Aestuariimicrobium sp. Y1814]|uniref:DUF6907 domain-containing protein n=1 Tax=Aestuariimicrobium sp. Y1814 TaxID=3418742 RepID=UPI003DA78111
MTRQTIPPCPDWCCWPAGHPYDSTLTDGRSTPVRNHESAEATLDRSPRPDPRHPDQLAPRQLGVTISIEELATPAGPLSTPTQVNICGLDFWDNGLTPDEARQLARLLNHAADHAEAHGRNSTADGSGAPDLT